MGRSASIGCDLAGRRIFSEKIENICRFDEGFNLVPKAGYSGPGWWCSIESEEFFYHLIFDCRGQLAIRKRTIQRLDIQDQNLRSIFLTKRGQDQLIKYLEESKIATRKWLLGLV